MSFRQTYASCILSNDLYKNYGKMSQVITKRFVGAELTFKKPSRFEQFELFFNVIMLKQLKKVQSFSGHLKNEQKTAQHSKVKEKNN